MADSLIQFKILCREHGLRPYRAEVAEVLMIVVIGNNGRMPGRFMYDIRRGRVFNVVQLADIRGDNQYAISLVLHKCGRRYKAVNRYRAPTDLAEGIIHLL